MGDFRHSLCQSAPLLNVEERHRLAKETCGQVWQMRALRMRVPWDKSLYLFTSCLTHPDADWLTVEKRKWNLSALLPCLSSNSHEPFKVCWSFSAQTEDWKFYFGDDPRITGRSLTSGCVGARVGLLHKQTAKQEEMDHARAQDAHQSKVKPTSWARERAYVVYTLYTSHILSTNSPTTIELILKLTNSHRAYIKTQQQQ